MNIQLGSAIRLTLNNETFNGVVVSIDEIGFAFVVGTERYSLLWESIQSEGIRVEVVETPSLKRAA